MRKGAGRKEERREGGSIFAKIVYRKVHQDLVSGGMICGPKGLYLVFVTQMLQKYEKTLSNLKYFAIIYSTIV